MKNKKLIWISIAVIVVIAIVAYYFYSKKTTAASTVQSKIADVKDSVTSTLPSNPVDAAMILNTAIVKSIASPSEKSFMEETAKNIVVAHLPDPTDEEFNAVYSDLMGKYIESMEQGKSHTESVNAMISYGSKYPAAPQI